MAANQSKFIRGATVSVSLACVLAMPALGFSQGEDASRFDLSTKEGVNAAREVMMGKPLDTRSANCVRRSQTLPIITVGRFAYDLGCRFEGVFVKSRYFGKGQMDWKDALDLLGWQTASAAEREKMALEWVEKSWLAFTTVLCEATEDFQGRSFQPPQVVSDDGSGEIAVTVWINPPNRGRGREKSYQRREFKFSRSGALVTAKTLENFTTAKDGG